MYRISLGLLVHFNFGPGLVPAQSYASLVTYLLSGVRLYLSPGTVRRAGIARAPCPAPRAVLRLPKVEITEAHIIWLSRIKRGRFVGEGISRKGHF